MGTRVVLATSPADGALVADVHRETAVRFNEAVALIAAQVLESTGSAVVCAGGGTVDGTELPITMVRCGGSNASGHV